MSDLNTNLVGGPVSLSPTASSSSQAPVLSSAGEAQSVVVGGKCKKRHFSSAAPEAKRHAPLLEVRAIDKNFRSMQERSMKIDVRSTFGSKARPDVFVNCATLMPPPMPLPKISFMPKTTIDALCELHRQNPGRKMGALVFASSTLAFDLQKDGREYSGDPKKVPTVEELSGIRLAQELGTVICIPEIAQNSYDAGIIKPNGGDDGKGPIVASRKSTVRHLRFVGINVPKTAARPLRLIDQPATGLRLIENATFKGQPLYVNKYRLVCDDKGEPMKFPRPIVNLDESGTVQADPDHKTKLAFIRDSFRYVNDIQSLYHSEAITPSIGFILRHLLVPFGSQGNPLGKDSFYANFYFFSASSLGSSADEKGSRRSCLNQALRAEFGGDLERFENAILDLREKASDKYKKPATTLSLNSIMKIVLFSDLSYAQLDKWLDGTYAVNEESELCRAHFRYMDQLIDICERQFRGVQRVGDEVFVIGSFGTGDFENDYKEVAVAYGKACKNLMKEGFPLPEIICADTNISKGEDFKRRLEEEILRQS